MVTRFFLFHLIVFALCRSGLAADIAAPKNRVHSTIPQAFHGKKPKEEADKPPTPIEQLKTLKEWGLKYFPLLEDNSKDPGLLDLLQSASQPWIANNLEDVSGSQVGMSNGGPKVYRYKTRIPIDVFIRALEPRLVILKKVQPRKINYGTLYQTKSCKS